MTIKLKTKYFIISLIFQFKLTTLEQMYKFEYQILKKKTTMNLIIIIIFSWSLRRTAWRFKVLISSLSRWISLSLSNFFIILINSVIVWIIYTKNQINSNNDAWFCDFFLSLYITIKKKTCRSVASSISSITFHNVIFMRKKEKLLISFWFI